MPSFHLLMTVMDAVRIVSGFSAKFSSVDKYNWSYIERPGKAADVIVFLHGFSSMKESWVRVARGVDKRYQILIPDLPGHGRTTPIDALANYSIPNQAERLHAFLEKEIFAEKKIHLVGCSMGGMLAGVNHDAKQERLAENAGDEIYYFEVLAHTPKYIHEMNRALSFKPMNLPNAVASIIAQERKKQLPMLEKIISDAMQHPTALEDLLPKIRAKTLVMWGKHDRVLDVSSVEVLQKKLGAEAQYLLFDDYGHIVQHEKTAECTAAIIKILMDDRVSDTTNVPYQETQNASGKLQLFARSARLIIPSFRLAAPSASKSSYVV